jgi:hypothetical protein
VRGSISFSISVRQAKIPIANADLNVYLTGELGQSFFGIWLVLSFLHPFCDRTDRVNLIPVNSVPIDSD